MNNPTGNTEPTLSQRTALSVDSVENGWHLQSVRELIKTQDVAPHRHR